MLAADPRPPRFFAEMCRGSPSWGGCSCWSCAAAANGRRRSATCSPATPSSCSRSPSTRSGRPLARNPARVGDAQVFPRSDRRQTMDSCADPNNAMINRLWPDRRAIVSYALPGAGASGRSSAPPWQPPARSATARAKGENDDRAASDRRGEARRELRRGPVRSPPRPRRPRAAQRRGRRRLAEGSRPTASSTTRARSRRRRRRRRRAGHRRSPRRDRPQHRDQRLLDGAEEHRAGPGLQRAARTSC